jgi:hypothetical protein
MSAQTNTEHRERAQTFARSGEYEDWRAVYAKMIFDGRGIDIFAEGAFTDEIDAVCTSARATR